MNTPLQRQLRARIRALSSPLRPRPTGLAPVTLPLEGVRAVLFDVYGTLVISASGDIGLGGERDESTAFRLALEAAGIRIPPGLAPDAVRDSIRRFHAKRRESGVAYPEVDILVVWRDVLARADRGTTRAATQRAGLPLAQLAVDYECRVNPVWPMPGLRRVLAEIAGRGLPLGIVSNAQFYTPLMLEALLEAPLEALGFDRDCCAFSYRLLEAKPSTRIYREALAGLAAKHGIPPGAVLYVGNDMRNDIWPATEVGCRTALFAGDGRSLRLRRDDPRCAGVTPDRIVTDLRQITTGLLPP